MQKLFIMNTINYRVASGLGAIGLNIADIIDNLNSVMVFIVSIVTIIYIGYGVYKRHLECKKIKKS